MTTATATRGAADAAVVSLRAISKQYGSTQALNDVSIDLHPGEAHVLMGENGAGKSTLVRILIGAESPDAGEVWLRGSRVHRPTPAAARRAGINAVLQDFSLVPTMTVLENLYLGREASRLGFISSRDLRRRATEVRELVGATFSLDAEVGALPRSEQQLAEIMKSVLGVPGVLLLDEPTAALSEGEAERLFGIVDRLKSEQWAILYITHRMAEVSRLGTRVTVMRDGKKIAEHVVGEVSENTLVEEMVGREIAAVYPPKATPDKIGDPVLTITSLSTRDGHVHDASLRVRAGEIVAVAGLAGAGKGHLARALTGLSPLRSGQVDIAGHTTTRPTARRLIARGVGFMPEDRKSDSLAAGLSVADNVSLEAFAGIRSASRAASRRRNATKQAKELIAQLDVRPPDPRQEVGLLSGGNQQKVVLARALTRPRAVYVVAEPTAGVDVGSRQQIYAVMRRLCDEGAGILMISSDLEEVLGMADRVYVMSGGRIQSVLEGDQISSEAVVAGAFGHSWSPDEQPSTQAERQA